MKLLLLILLLCLSCDNKSIGTCEHEYIEPVIKIASVTDINTNENVPKVLINNIAFDKVKVHSSFFYHTTQYNITKNDSSLICSIPSGFGTKQGEYKFVISAEGYKPKEVSLLAIYKINNGGCPSYNDGGTELKIKLDRK